jgi:pimeloyl-ACP methyl ester carboxylesterase
MNQRLLHKFFTLLLLLSLLLAAIPTPVQAADFTPTFQTVNCSTFKIEQEQIPPLYDVICGYVTVPERHNAPQGKTIELAVVIIHNPNTTTAPDPLFLAQGGPGGSTIDTYASMLFYRQPGVMNDRDIVLFDQRGTLYSNPNLVCNEMLDLSIELLNVDLPDEQITQRSITAIQACRDRLISQGIDLAAYNSYENAHDINDIRIALGYEKINLYGVSYGTLLAQHAMRLHPGMLRSVIIDSVVPTSINFITEVPQTQDRSLRALFSACQADRECATSYPNLEQTLFDTIEKLNQHPVHIRLTDPETSQSYPALLNGDSVFYALFMALYSSEFIPYLPRLIQDAQRGEYSLITYLLSILTFDRSISYGMYYSVLCAEDADFSPQDANTAGVYPYLAKDAEKDLEEMQKVCQLWHNERFDAQVDAPIISDIPTLVINGQFDPITPPAFGEQAAQQLSHSYIYTLPLGSHGSFLSQPCADDLMMSFLSNPNSPPTQTCAANPTPDFLTRSDFLPIPILSSFAMLKDRAVIASLIIYAIHLVLLFTFVLVWPAALLLGKRRPILSPSAQATNALAAWLPLAIGFWNLILIGLLFYGVGKLALEENMLLFFGLPRLFTPLPIIAIIITLLNITMIWITFSAWHNKIWSIARRIYYTLLTFSSLVGIFLFVQWGVLQALWVP